MSESISAAIRSATIAIGLLFRLAPAHEREREHASGRYRTRMSDTTSERATGPPCFSVPKRAHCLSQPSTVMVGWVRAKFRSALVAGQK